MSLRSPTKDEIRELGERLHFDLTDDEVEDFAQLVAGSLGMYETVHEWEPSNAPDRTTGRPIDTGRRVREGDPYNAWITRCDLDLGVDGPLSGWDVGVKDNIAVAGIEMTCGSLVMEGYVPDYDATIVSRLLEAGARIVGKNNMDNMALAGNGSSSAFGPTLNPRDPDYLAGGSSGGGAIAVATGEVDLAIGGDQGGSVRAPAAWSGVVGFKPSHGLVPYTGIVGLENSIDHIGTFATTVPETARALTVLAGSDPVDPRMPESVPTQDYEADLVGDLESTSIAVIEEGFTRPEHETGVNEQVRAALDVLEDKGATVEEVSVPIHDAGADIYTVALMEGMLAAISGEGIGHNWKGWYNTGWVEAFGKFRRSQGGDFPPTVKLALLTGAYTSERYHSKYYAKAMNLREELSQQYHELTQEFDVIATPSTPQTAQKHQTDDDRIEFVARAWTSLSNVSPFNASGQPAISVPIRPADGLPVGLQLVGQHFDDATVLDVAYGLEQTEIAGEELYDSGPSP